VFARRGRRTERKNVFFFFCEGSSVHNTNRRACACCRADAMRLARFPATLLTLLARFASVDDAERVARVAPKSRTAAAAFVAAARVVCRHAPTVCRDAVRAAVARPGAAWSACAAACVRRAASALQPALAATHRTAQAALFELRPVAGAGAHAAFVACEARIAVRCDGPHPLVTFSFRETTGAFTGPAPGTPACWCQLRAPPSAITELHHGAFYAMLAGDAFDAAHLLAAALLAWSDDVTTSWSRAHDRLWRAALDAVKVAPSAGV
jgi:hypothetical protein